MKTEPHTQYHLLPENHYHRHPDRKQCTHFGCGKVLSMVESLAGSKCLQHQHTPGIDPVRVIKL